MSELATEVIKSFGILIGGAIVYYAPKFNEWLSKRKVKSKFQDTILIQNEINHILDELRVKYDATRVNIMDYHNGKSSVMGVPFNYVTMTAESTDSLTAPLISKIQSMPIAPAIPLLVRLMEEKTGWIHTTDEDANEQIAILQKVYGCKGSYTFMLNDSIACGTLVISYSADYDYLTSKEILDIKAAALKLHLLRSKIKH